MKKSKLSDMKKFRKLSTEYKVALVATFILFMGSVTSLVFLLHAHSIVVNENSVIQADKSLDKAETATTIVTPLLVVAIVVLAVSVGLGVYKDARTKSKKKS